jgi:hydroxypyruvate isomerase
MIRVAANVSLLFTELPLPQRFAAARAAGFRAVELQFPYGHALEELQDALQASGLPLVLHNLPGGDAARGERGLACLPGRQAEFRESVVQAVRYAQALGAPRLNCLAGVLPPGVAPDEAHVVLVQNLRHAAATLAQAGLTLLVEPINHFDVPGYLVNTSAQALALLAEVKAANLRVQFDLYHAARMGEDVAAVLAHSLAHIGHVQFADVPGRHEPGSGALPLQTWWRQLRALGYGGDVGAEYHPQHRTQDGLSWLPEAQSLLQ